MLNILENIRINRAHPLKARWQNKTHLDGIVAHLPDDSDVS